ncbi:MAG: PASTA domain-containing protein [Gemmatimonadaceae bacterium]|nr:PASTA domain-containing protein [Gemmatimonadaceae bacterium]
MNWRAWSRRSIPYLVVGVGGFLLAYVIIFLFAFRSDVIPDDTIVPNVVGRLYEDAATTIEQAGFFAQQGEQRISKTAPKGSVLQQDPPGGSRQKKGTDILLAISLGKKEAVVPQIVGLTPQQARLAVENAGFQLGRTIELPSDYPRGTVFQVEPAPGTQVDLPAEVNFTVSAGPATVQVPDLVGRSVPDARSALEPIGLRLGNVGRDTSSIQVENSVLRQSPPAGATVSAGASVGVVISRFPPPTPLPGFRPLDSLTIARKIHVP